MKLNKSPWCLKYLTEYKGNTTLNDFLESGKIISSKIFLSFCLQLAKIVLLLYKGGYSHNDLHPGNIMINKTNIKYFSFNGKKIPTYGIQLQVIDYDGILQYDTMSSTKN
jgi:serine/threonine protein kinase